MELKILIVEDEKNIAESLSIILEESNFKVQTTMYGLDGFKKYNDFDLLVLDLMLPDIDGIEVLKKIREKNKLFPIIIISAKNDEDDIIEGLSAGADDYVVKPFSVKELVLRIKRTLDRKISYEKLPDKKELTKIGTKFSINFSTLVAKTNEGVTSLTSQEAAVLEYLIKNSGKIISRKELLEKTWGYSGEIETRTVDNFMVRFRKYFETHPKKPKHFITKRGVGYIFKN